MKSSSQIPVLGRELRFPDPAQARPDGLLALGGDLSVERLLEAYRQGIFPWSASPISWWSPDPRGVIELDDFHLSRRVQRKMRQNLYRVTFNQDFHAVIQACAAPAPGREETWIEPALSQAYLKLHQAGHAHSVECWLGEKLIGGVYGVAVGGLFAGESMFSHARDGSKIALAALIEHLRARGFVLFDIQMTTPHTESLGARAMPRREYLNRLATAVTTRCSFIDKDKDFISK
jgi:leucyl/phenylalanyl-tRNA---protein transferase